MYRVIFLFYDLPMMLTIYSHLCPSRPNALTTTKFYHSNFLLRHPFDILFLVFAEHSLPALFCSQVMRLLDSSLLWQMLLPMCPPSLPPHCCLRRRSCSSSKLRMNTRRVPLLYLVPHLPLRLQLSTLFSPPTACGGCLLP